MIFCATSLDYSRSGLLLYIELVYEFFRMENFNDRFTTSPDVFATVLGIEEEIVEEVVRKGLERIEFDDCKLGPHCSGRYIADDSSRWLL
jgi:hypothetical protein